MKYILLAKEHSMGVVAVEADNLEDAKTKAAEIYLKGEMYWFDEVVDFEEYTPARKK